MTILIALLLGIAALMSWATALAYLKDTTLTRAHVAATLAQIGEAARMIRRVGWVGVDRDALSASVRPFLRVALLVIIAGTGFVAMFEALQLRFGLFSVSNLLALALFMAMQSPCPYILYILRGDRRSKDQPFDGKDRRRVR